MSETGPGASRQERAGSARRLGELTARLGHDFHDVKLLRRALTHASATRGSGGEPISYERLEFLGDRVLGLIIAALYLDSGLSAAERFVLHNWMPFLEAEHRPPLDAKTALQEWAQGRALPLPSYQEIAREGPPHEPLFTVEVRVEGLRPASAQGRSKRIAEQAAAECLLAQVEDAADDGSAS